nr:YadA-like family protein [Collimonas fungivorans]
MASIASDISPLVAWTPVYGDVTGSGAIAIGSASNAVGVDTVALGRSSQAIGNGAVALGTTANATGTGSIAIGGGVNNVIWGPVASGDYAITIGSGSTASGNNSVAIGDHAQATATNSVALGANSATGIRTNVVAVGAAGSERQIVNVADGTAATDAATFGQLTTTNNNVTALTTRVGTNETNIAGNTADITALNTQLSTTNTNVTNNATNITTLEGKLNSGAVGMVQQSAAGADLTVGAANDGAAVNFAGTAGNRTLSGVADGVNASDAATFGQLTTTNNNVTALDGRVTQNTTDINTLAGQIGSGTVGLVQQSAAGADLTVGSTTDGAVVNFAGTAGNRTLSGVADGVNASDAATFGQLTTTNNNVTALDGRVTQNTTDINVLAGQIGSGTVGLVQQSAAGADLTVGSTTDGAVVNFAGTAGNRTLSGVADGVNANDAVNFGQLTATNNNVTALDGRVGIAETNITSINTTLADLGAGLNGAVVYNSDKSAVSLGGVNGTLINNLSAGLIGAGSMQAVNGGQLFSMKADLDAQLQKIVDNADAAIGIIGGKLDDLTGAVGDQGKQLDDLDGRVGDIEQGIADGTIGGGGNGGVNPAGNAQVGVGADASGKNSSAVGSGAIASGENSTAVGSKAEASGKDSTAVGANSSATGSNSVAIGAGSVADRDNSVSFGSAGNERQLTNVADGTAPTDAVNKRQLDGAISGVNDRIDRLDQRVDELGAMSTASAQMAMSTAGLVGNNRLGVGIGAMNGQSALALGYQRVYGQGTRTLSVGGAASTRGTLQIGAGAGFSW